MTAPIRSESNGVTHAPDAYLCPFCALIVGTPTAAPVLSDVVHENAAAVVLVSPRWWTRNPGHLLVLPKRHHEHL